MNDTGPGPPHVEHGCPLSAAVSLADALTRLEREAVHGVFENGRYRCRYYVWGDGPPLLLVPGMSDDSRSFVLLTANLCGAFRCIAYDLPSGRGDGARLGRYHHADFVLDAFALLDHLQVGRSYVLGSSFGSTIALQALHDGPERLPRGILQGGFAHRPLAPVEVLLARLARHWLGRMNVVPFRKALQRRFHYAPFAARPADVWAYFLERVGATPICAEAHRALLIHRLDLRPLLEDIRQPIHS